MCLVDLIWLEYVGCHEAEDKSTQWQRDGDQTQLAEVDGEVDKRLLAEGSHLVVHLEVRSWQSPWRQLLLMT